MFKCKLYCGDPVLLVVNWSITLTHKLYRDKDLKGYEELELDLEQEMIDWLEQRAIMENKTVDEVLENILWEAIRDAEVDDTPK